MEVRDISVIIPTYNNPDIFKNTIGAVILQSLPPKEIIVIDSSSTDDIKNIIENTQWKLEINYQKFSRLFPGEARNQGAKIAKFDFLAFLDSKTIPDKDWLKINVNYLLEKKFDVVFGSTKYTADTRFQIALRASVYGRNAIETTPGTLISKDNFILSGGFEENIRTGDDLYWRKQIKNLSISSVQPNEITLKYSQLEKNIFTSIWRFFSYQIYAAQLAIQDNSKRVYLFFFFLLLAFLVPKWNSIVGWEDSLLYIPNITKIYFFVYFLIVFFTWFFDKFIKQFLSLFFKKILIMLTLVNLLLFVYLWNGGVAEAESSALYIPHITKIYVLSLFMISFVYRGIYFPLYGGIHAKELFPFNWIYFGITGLILDIAKAPGYLMGGLFFLVRKR
jgi:glycosyltransferase involved in cell wall biosynthesis